MKKFRFKKLVKPAVYTGALATLFLSFALIESTSEEPLKDNNDFQYVNNSIFTSNIPVVKEQSDVVIIKPYSSDKVEISKKFYDNTATDEEKENALIYYNDTYMQNSGILYKSDEQFEVLSILDGTVIDVKKDEILGNVVEVKHSNNLISTYQGLSEVSVKKDQTINSGQQIGKSGKLELGEPLENALLFELIKDGKYINPLNYFDKKLSEI
ncbi:MAG: M23 family metallopeptidase [Bacilli bacterium]|nr:M23 family metallopeptidase [Bacilli bacterium]